MITIHKFALGLDSDQSVYINEGADILCAQFQHDTLCVWALVDTKSPLKVRQFEIFGTGHVIPPASRRYIGTVQMAGGQLVWHIFERTNQ